jgi:hypothetical protein
MKYDVDDEIYEAISKMKYDIKLKPKNLIAKDLRSPKYRMRVVDSKVAYERNPKHKGKVDYDE